MTGRRDGDGDAPNLRPVPDPTTLTTDAIEREIAALRELLMALISAMSELNNERFQTVEHHRLEQKLDTKEKIDAALLAQQGAANKSELAIKDQLNQLSNTFDTAIGGVTDGLADVKDRVGKIEAIKVGGQEKVAAFYAFAGFLTATVVFGGALAASGLFAR